MRVRLLRPVGESVPLMTWGRAVRAPDWQGYTGTWVDSGTTALGVAIAAAATLSGQAKRSVILPAFGCPDLVAAAKWAGVTPRLVDTQAGRPWLDEAAVARAIDASVCAVVAPHFLGLRHPLNNLMEICQRRGIVLIEDSAQLGPASPSFCPEADLVVLSFGRGKPVPAGGGLLLARGSAAPVVARVAAQLPEAGAHALGWQLRTLVQNLAITRVGFGLVARIPWLRVGETRYKDLRSPHRLRTGFRDRVQRVIARWRVPEPVAERAYQKLFGAAGQSSLASELGWDGVSPLLRYPALVQDITARDSVCEELNRHGIGASLFYGSALPDLPEMPDLETRGGIENARAFAARLLTLPTHSGLQPTDIRLIAQIADKKRSPQQSVIDMPIRCQTPDETT
jgi:dTDP-4-amino-4,6-dideoxygalactose transaminase